MPSQRSFRQRISRMRAKWRRMSHSEFASWSSGIQSLFIASAVIIGAFWTVYLYVALKQEGTAANTLVKSQVEIQSLRAGLEKAQDEARRAFGLVTLTATPVSSDSQYCFLQINAQVSNAGNREILLWFKGDSAHPYIYPPLNVARVEIDSSHAFSFRTVAQIPVHTITQEGWEVVQLPQSRLLPGESSTFPFLVRIPHKGIHLVQFQVPVDTAKRVQDQPPSQPDSLWFWAARTYVTGCAKAPASASESDRGTM